jgi:hypothetical protein
MKLMAKSFIKRLHCGNEAAIFIDDQRLTVGTKTNRQHFLPNIPLLFKTICPCPANAANQPRGFFRRLNLPGYA